MCTAKWQENGLELYKNVAAAAQMFPTLFQGTMKRQQNCKWAGPLPERLCKQTVWPYEEKLRKQKHWLQWTEQQFVLILKSYWFLRETMCTSFQICIAALKWQ